MFEKATPPVISSAHSATTQDASNRDQFTDRISDLSVPVEVAPLRTIEWNELTARLNAARDLRQLFREDLGRGLGAAKPSPEKLGFATAAAQFFRASEEGERCVNPNSLEPRKSLVVIQSNIKSKGHDKDHIAEELCSNTSHPARLLQSNTREKE